MLNTIHFIFPIKDSVLKSDSKSQKNEEKSNRDILHLESTSETEDNGKIDIKCIKALYPFIPLNNM